MALAGRQVAGEGKPLGACEEPIADPAVRVRTRLTSPRLAARLLGASRIRSPDLSDLLTIAA